MRRCFAAALLLLVAGCAAGPEVAADRSAVYGVVTARPHSEVLAKWSAAPAGADPSYGPGRVAVPEDAIDYDRLSEIHVGLVDPARAAAATHRVTFFDTRTDPESLAVAPGDVIRIRNAGARPLTFFLAATEGEAFQDIARVPAGGSAEARVRITGLLDLATDEDERLTAHVLARRGLSARRLASGGEYVFTDLAPGTYRLIFWNWRLGALERSVDLVAGKASRVDEVLAVDRTVR